MADRSENIAKLKTVEAQNAGMEETIGILRKFEDYIKEKCDLDFKLWLEQNDQ